MTKRGSPVPPMAQVAERPYPASWMDRLIHWVEARPGPAWSYYIAGIVIFGLIATPLGWMAGYIPVASMSPLAFAYVAYQVYIVALMHYLDREAGLALAKFRPALQVTDRECSRIEYELTTVPATGAWMATAFALLIAVVDIITVVLPSGSGPVHLAGLIILEVVTAVSFATFLILVYHVTRQLRMVSRIHGMARTINIFQPRPLYAFSRLTALSGTGLVFFAYYTFLLTPPEFQGPVTYLLTGVVLALAAAVFLLPLLGMHQRLVLAKGRLDTEVNSGFEAAHHDLQEAVHSRNFANVDDIHKTVSSLVSLREVIAKFSTWPWNVETLRGFVAALLIPIVVWAITRALERLISF